MFKLSQAFFNNYKDQTPDFGPLGQLVYVRSYSRVMDNGEQERFPDTCKRVVEGVFQIQQRHCKTFGLPWDGRKAQSSAQEMFRRMFSFRFLPPGRGLWALGSDFMWNKTSACLFNCAFRSTKDIDLNFSAPFTWIFEMSLVGTGCGFDTEGAKKKVHLVEPTVVSEKHVVEDSREGWVRVTGRVLDAFVGKDTLPNQIDYSQIRPAGAPIKGFGGVAPGSQPLQNLIEKLLFHLRRYVKDDKAVDSTLIVDITNLIGAAVVAGGARRTALLALGEFTDAEFAKLKDSETLSDPMLARWSSNNTLRTDKGVDYGAAAEQTATNGEPGYLWIHNAQNYGRMKDPATDSDFRVAGVNPCLPGTATVITPDGIRTFDEITKGSVIWSGSNWTTVLNKWSTGVKSVYSYSTTAGVFTSTADHRIVQNGAKVQVKDAISIDTAVGPVAAKGYDVIDVMDGLVIGDGSVHKASNNLVYLIIGYKDQDYLTSEIAPFLSKHRPGLNKLAWEIVTSISPKELPKTYVREVPPRFIHGSTREKAGFLRGLFSANGSVIRDRVTLRQSSLAMIRQVQEMLSSMGMISYITVNKASKIQHRNGTYVSKQSYTLNITRDRNKYAELIGFLQNYKVEKLNKVLKPAGSKAKISYEITNVTYKGELPVYDITVDDPAHTFWSGGLLVSNCGEIPLEDAELCNICETFPSRHESLSDYLQTLKYAYMYCKTVTLLPTHSQITNQVQMRNRRIGVSQSGIVENIQKVGFREHMRWCDEGYQELKKLDKVYSEWLCVPTSKRLSTVKPSGSVSLLPQVTPGVHFPHSEYYIRRVRLTKGSDLSNLMEAAGYPVEPDVNQPEYTTVVSIPVKEKNFSNSKADVSMWQQLELAAQMQAYWADNAVSVTVTIKPEEAKDLPRALEMYESRLKSVSFLPLKDHKYAQAPYEEIDQKTYESMIAKISPVDLSQTFSEKKIERFCDGDSCTI